MVPFNASMLLSFFWKNSLSVFVFNDSIYMSDSCTVIIFISIGMLRILNDKLIFIAPCIFFICEASKWMTEFVPMQVQIFQTSLYLSLYRRSLTSYTSFGGYFCMLWFVFCGHKISLCGWLFLIGIDFDGDYFDFK